MYYERNALFKASNGETYQLFRGFTYMGKQFFNLINVKTGWTRVSDLSKYIVTTRNAVSIEELNKQFAPLTFTYVGKVDDYMLLPKSLAQESTTPQWVEAPHSPTPPQRSLLDEIYTLLDAI